MLDLDAEAIYRTLAARAREMYAGASLRLVGVHTGGVWLAERLRHDLHVDAPVGILDVSFYRDDSTWRTATSCWSMTCFIPAAPCAQR